MEARNVVLLLAAAVSLGLADGSAQGGGGSVFRPLLADPKEPQFFASYLWDHSPRLSSKLATVGVGQTIGLVREPNWELAIAAGVFSQFNMQSATNDLINTDYLVGLPFTYRHGSWATRFRLYHQSSHLGDEYLLHTNAQRVDLTFEAAELLVSKEIAQWRVYGGGEYLFAHSRPGASWRGWTPDRCRTASGRWAGAWWRGSSWPTRRRRRAPAGAGACCSRRTRGPRPTASSTAIRCHPWASGSDSRCEPSTLIGGCHAEAFDLLRRRGARGSARARDAPRPECGPIRQRNRGRRLRRPLRRRQPGRGRHRRLAARLGGVRRRHQVAAAVRGRRRDQRPSARVGQHLEQVRRQLRRGSRVPLRALGCPGGRA